MLVLALACGANAVRRASGPTPHGVGGVDAATDGERVGVDAEAPVDPLVELAASQDRIAPGMREVQRRHLELRDGGQIELPAPTVDTCFRVAFAAKELVEVSFVDGSGASLAEARGTSPRLGPRGPVCVRAGQTSTLSLRGAGAVDALIWASP